jgi:hypothetical protein
VDTLGIRGVSDGILFAVQDICIAAAVYVSGMLCSIRFWNMIHTQQGAMRQAAYSRQ